MNFQGYKRDNGKVGIRNKILIIAYDECCDGIARSIAKGDDDVVILTNWYTCMLGGNEESFNQMIEVGKHPNVAAALVIGMGCGSIDPLHIVTPIRENGTSCEFLVCQKERGTKKSILKGREIVQKFKDEIKTYKKEPIPMGELVVGVKCGGSDTSSGIASNPSVGMAVDKLVDLGATCIGGELFELIGCEEILSKRAKNDKVKEKIYKLIDNETKRWSVEGTDVETMSIGNSLGGLTTIEEKSLGALHKMGTKPIIDVLQVNKEFVDKPHEHGFYLSETTMLCGGSGVNFASFGAHIILWTSGAAGFNNPIVPVIRVSGNEELYNDDMDIDARSIMRGTGSVEDVADDIVDKINHIANGELTNVEGFGSATMTLYQKDQRVEKLLDINCIH